MVYSYSFSLFFSPILIWEKSVKEGMTLHPAHAQDFLFFHSALHSHILKT